MITSGYVDIIQHRSNCTESEILANRGTQPKFLGHI